MSNIKVGFKFKRLGKNRQDETVVDILTTKDIRGEIVRVEYLCTHEFLGQTVSARHVRTTLLRAQAL